MAGALGKRQEGGMSESGAARSSESTDIVGSPVLGKRASQNILEEQGVPHARASTEEVACWVGGRGAHLIQLLIGDKKQI